MPAFPPDFSDRVSAAQSAAHRVLVTTCVPEQHTAWTKARRDVARIAQRLGYRVLPMPAGLHPVDWTLFLADLARLLAPGGRVLVEYPLDLRRRLYPLAMFCRLRRLWLDGLIHDLDALRFDSPHRREIGLLQLFDGLVSHNPSMTAWLQQHGIDRPIVDLALFDYLTDSQGTWHEQDLQPPVRIVCAGNLSFAKARYLYDPRLSAVQGAHLSLFGAFFDAERWPSASTASYRGVFDPEAPMLDGRYHFGLVWDGDDVCGCCGAYGHYLRFNNPHKLSLYAALGLPVVVWEEAAVARFVQAQGIGVTVRDLRELGQLATRVDTAQYRQMTRRMTAVGQSVRRGEFLARALTALALDRTARPDRSHQVPQNG